MNGEFLPTIRVLQGFQFGQVGRTENPYIDLFVGSLPEGVVSISFSWRAAFVSRYDLVHVHWPEFFTRASGWRQLAKLLVFLALLGRWRLTGTRIVRTLHNDAPHETGSALERFVLGCLDRMTDEWIVMNRASNLPAGRIATHIPHGHYRDAVLPPQRHPVDGAVLYFGLIREYKGVDDLIEVVRGTPAVSVLRVMGDVRSPSLRERIRTLAAGDERIHLDLKFVSDHDLAEATASSSAVILPYRNLTKSGALLFALSMSCPVIVPRVATTIELQSEFGEEWVVLYDPPLSVEKLNTALAEVVRVEPGRVVNMSGREWRRLGVLTESVYISAIRGRSRKTLFRGRRGLNLGGDHG